MGKDGKVRCYNEECGEVLEQKVVRYTSSGGELYFCSDECGSVFAAMKGINLYRENPSDKSGLERRV